MRAHHRKWVLSCVIVGVYPLAALAQRFAAPAPAPRPQPVAPRPQPAAPRPSATYFTPRDTLGAYGLGANAGLRSGAPFSPQTTVITGASGAATGQAQYFLPRIGSTSPQTGDRGNLHYNPLFPYANDAFPYGYGGLGREEPPDSLRPPSQPRVHRVDANSATVRVRLPNNADVWFGDAKTNQLGEERTFFSPALEPGHGYTYAIRVKWKQDGKDLEETRKVRIKAGDELEIDFRTPSK